MTIFWVPQHRAITWQNVMAPGQAVVVVIPGWPLGLPKQLCRADELYIGRHDIPLGSMIRSKEQRAIDHELVQMILTNIAETMMTESRKLWPIRVIIATPDDETVTAILQRRDLTNSDHRFYILDGQHRHLAASLFVEKAQRNGEPIDPALLSWSCEIYRHGKPIIPLFYFIILKSR